MDKEQSSGFVGTPEERRQAISKIAKTIEFPEYAVEFFYGNTVLHPAVVATGKKMKEIREEKGLSREDIKNHIYCSPAFLELIEEGLIPPTVETGLAFAKYFDLPWEDIFGDVAGLKTSIFT